MLHVGEEALAGLLAVVGDVDTGFGLQLDDVTGRIEDRVVHRGRIDGLMTAVAPQHLGQSAGGRSRLPACVVRIRLSDRFIALSPAVPRRLHQSSRFAHRFVPARQRNKIVATKEMKHPWTSAKYPRASNRHTTSTCSSKFRKGDCR
jgi:hypothetical protein